MAWRDQLALLLGAASPFGLMATDGQAAEPIRWLDGPRADPPEIQKDLLLFRDPAERERLLLFAGHRSHSSHSSHRSHYSSSGGHSSHSSHSSHYSSTGGYTTPAPVRTAPVPPSRPPVQRYVAPVSPSASKDDEAGQDVLKRQRLSPDEVREMVQKVQVALVVRGFDPGPLTGTLNDPTRIALGRFQAARGLPISGLLDLRTLQALGVDITMSSRGTPSVPQPAADLAGAARLPLIDQPNWIAQPGEDFIWTYYPSLAGRSGVEGQVNLLCEVTETGELHSCQVQGEVPKGHGFAEAAVRLAPFFRLNPLDLDGQPVGGKAVQLAVGFKRPLPPAVSRPESFIDPTSLARTLGPIEQPRWAALPGDDFIGTFHPEQARRLQIGGQVVLDCIANVTGELEACQIRSEAPAGYGFGSAALRVAPFFRLSRLDQIGRPVGGRSVKVVVNFKRPA